MFCDEVKLRLIAGRGGHGALSFRKEKYVPYGGPDGGDGGRGGNVYFIVDNNIHTLADYKSRKDFAAENGQNGMKKNMHGKNGEDLYLKVPPGTLIFDAEEKKLLADLTKIGETYLAIKGGRGGFGNAHFTSSTRKTPSFAEKGEPGEEQEVIVELKMIAEVGIIGLPSAGKSTLIAHISNAKPKIADYPFTTLVPNLGVVNLDKFGGDSSQEFVVADVPGLIPGASEGKGLGHTFLKHVQRTRVLIHLLDGTLEDLVKNVTDIEEELEKYDQKLLSLPNYLVINKIDSILPDELKKKIKQLQKKFPKRKIYSISGVTGEGMKTLLFDLWKEISSRREHEKEATEANLDKEEESAVSKPQVFNPLAEISEKRTTVKKLENREDKQVFRIEGKRLEQIVVMSDLYNEQAVNRIYDVLKKMGLLRRLRQLGAKDGDILKIGGEEIEFLDLLD